MTTKLLLGIILIATLGITSTMAAGFAFIRWMEPTLTTTFKPKPLLYSNGKILYSNGTVYDLDGKPYKGNLRDLVTNLPHGITAPLEFERELPAAIKYPLGSIPPVTLHYSDGTIFMDKEGIIYDLKGKPFNGNLLDLSRNLPDGITAPVRMADDTPVRKKHTKLFYSDGALFSDERATIYHHDGRVVDGQVSQIMTTTPPGITAPVIQYLKMHFPYTMRSRGQ